MPNWCTNYVEIRTDDPELYQAMLTRIEAAQEAKEDHQGFFHSFIPCPAELLDNDLTTWGGSEEEQTAREVKKAANKDKYGHTDWYDWRCEKWGTKWDVRDIEYYDGGDCIELRFETAWSPPIPIYEEMERLGYHVKAKYGDEMTNFVGDWSNGVDKCYSLDQVPDRLKDFIARWVGEDQEEDNETTV